MAAGSQPPHHGGDNPGVRADVEGRGDEGKRAAEASPPIGEQPGHGRTQQEALPDDVGVPPDEELGRPD